MPLEDLTGTKYIANLNENWPLGTDYPDAGDNHIRGIKNVLKKQFPNLGSEAVIATAAQLNTAGGFPSGVRMIFYMSNAPSGWTRVTGIADTKALRVVASASVGGGSGGTDDPILNNKVASHQHVQGGSVAVSAPSVQHSHTATAAVADGGAHTHAIYGSTDTASANCLGSKASTVRAFAGTTGGAGAGTHTTFAASAQQCLVDAAVHTHVTTVTVADSADSHTHTATLSGSVAANTGAANWTPRYLDVIICEKT